MSKLFSLDSPVIQFLSKVFDVMLLGLMWFLGCLPIVTIGASTTAMNTVLIKLVNDDAYSVTRLFLTSFKENFKQATLIWLMFFGALILLAGDLLVVWIMGAHWIWTVIFAMLVVLTVLAVIMLIYVFPLQAYYSNTIKNTIKNSLMFALGYLPKTIAMLLVDITISIFFLVCAAPLLLFAGVLMALFNAWLLNTIFKNHPGTQKQEDTYATDNGEV